MITFSNCHFAYKENQSSGFISSNKFKIEVIDGMLIIEPDYKKIVKELLIMITNYTYLNMTFTNTLIWDGTHKYGNSGNSGNSGTVYFIIADQLEISANGLKWLNSEPPANFFELQTIFEKLLPFI